MGDWIESHVALARHPKTLRLADLLHCSRATALGHVHLLWYWALDYAPTGVIRADAMEMVARECDWRGKPGVFWEGLQLAGFVNGCSTLDVQIHDWIEYSGRLLSQREAHRQRAARAYSARRMPADGEQSAHIVHAAGAQSASLARAGARAGPTNQPTGRDTAVSLPVPTNPVLRAENDDGAPSEASPRGASRDPDVIHAEAGQCPLCRRVYTGPYLEHTAEFHAVRKEAEPGNLGSALGRRARRPEDTMPDEVRQRLSAQPIGASNGQNGSVADAPGAGDGAAGEAGAGRAAEAADGDGRGVVGAASDGAAPPLAGDARAHGGAA